MRTAVCFSCIVSWNVRCRTSMEWKVWMDVEHLSVQSCRQLCDQLCHRIVLVYSCLVQYSGVVVRRMCDGNTAYINKVLKPFINMQKHNHQVKKLAIAIKKAVHAVDSFKPFWWPCWIQPRSSTIPHILLQWQQPVICDCLHFGWRNRLKLGNDWIIPKERYHKENFSFWAFWRGVQHAD